MQNIEKGSFAIGIIIGMILLFSFLVLLKIHVDTHDKVKKIIHTEKHIKVMVESDRIFYLDKTDTLNFDVGDNIKVILKKDFD
jgi:hypothetical protein